MSRKLSAKGLLQHHFWGTYHASIVLMFEGAEEAGDALKILTGNWVQSKKDPCGVYGTFDREELTPIESQLAAFGADLDKMNSLEKSIDFGEEFTIAMEVSG